MKQRFKRQADSVSRTASGSPAVQRPVRATWLRRWGGCAALLVAAFPGLAHAQLGLPRVNLPSLPRDLPATLRDTTQSLAGVPPALTPLGTTRLDRVRRLLRDQPALVEADPAGEPVRRGELVWTGPEDGELARATGQGFEVLRTTALPELGLRLVVLRPPRSLSLAAAKAALESLAPERTVDYQHLMLPSGDMANRRAAAAASGPSDPSGENPLPSVLRLGLIDGGIDRSHASLREAPLKAWGCEGRVVPSPHGTAVASLLVGRNERFRGSAPGASLWAADVYCGSPVGGAVEQVAAALAWMARERVGVINVSLVGPRNAALEAVVRVMVQRGHLIVAAVGNDGPAAAPMYPAAVPGVVAVTGVSPSRRILPEAARGSHVLLSAPGSEVAVADPAGGFVEARGTSFAAPFVAGLLSAGLPEADPERAAAVLRSVLAQAEDLGAPGPDPVYGHGLVGETRRLAMRDVDQRRR